MNRVTTATTTNTTVNTTMPTTTTATDMTAAGSNRPAGHAQIERIRRWHPAPGVATMAIIGASIATAAAALFARRLVGTGLSPVSVAFFRYASAALVLAPFLRLTGPKRTATWWGLASGAAAGLGWIAYVESIRNGELATAGVAYMTYPVFTLIACRLLFRRTASVRSIGSATLVVVAAVVTFGPGSSTGIAPLLFVAPATFGFGVAILTERLAPLDPFERLSAVAMGASLALAPLIVTLPTARVVPTSLGACVSVVGIGVGCALVPMLVYGAAAPAIGAARTAVAGGAELPTIFVIGALFFGEPIRLEHLAAGAIIVVAIALAPSVRSIHVIPGSDELPASNDRSEGRSGLVHGRRQRTN